MKINKIFFIFTLLALSACSTYNPKSSYSENVQQQSYSVISNDIAKYTSTVLPAGSALIWVNPAPQNNELNQSIENALRQYGFAIAPSSTARPQNAYEIRYWIEPDDKYNQSIMVRMFIKNKLISRVFSKAQDGNFIPNSPYSVME
ncbi:hypothetical protein [Commensalibacter nepenthis]|uniref:Conjugal transfer protein TrbH n=1 Tax=Commensalibacter nepenthis TaxID=3043872 RepID=A0ABT6QAF2_9PROT|nr:hypothetical protein [Commensalibacter sp. TBRC 10068]MDI2113884.1 hypothetical protein [Commensalibacter sp. TBRC 10068]